MYPIIRFNGQVYSSYALLTYISFIVAAIYFYYAATRIEKLSPFKVLLYLFLVYFVQWAGGWLIPGIYKWFTRGPFPLSDLPKKGRYFHSVLLSSLAFTVLYAKLMRWPVMRFLDQFAIGVTIMSAIGRIGCYLHGCCGGKACDLPWAVQFKFSKEPVHPTQLYHLFFEALILLPLLFYMQKRKRSDGETFWAFVLVYSIFRFIVEFFRTNPPAWAGLSHAQLFSAFTVALVGIVCWIRRKKASS